MRMEGIPVMDDSKFSSYDCNAYLRIKVGSKWLKTKVFNRKKKSKDTDCYFYEEIKFGITWPMAYDKVEMQIMDKETFGADNIIGAITVELKKIVKEFGEIPDEKTIQ